MSHKLETSIWQEVASSTNEFQAQQCFCYGYDVHNDLLKNANWIDYLFLLITGSKPTVEQAKLLEKIAIILANPGIRDLSVRGAMNAGVGKAPPASVLIAALSVGSGQFSGAKEISLVMDCWKKNIDRSMFDLSITQNEEKDIWPDVDHKPGFDPHSSTSSDIITGCLDTLSSITIAKYLNWLKLSKTKLESASGQPISITGVIAAAFCDLSLTQQQSEFLYLILRLPGAAAHAMEQEKLGWRKFPFFSDSVALTVEHSKTTPPNVDDLIKGYVDDE